MNESLTAPDYSAPCRGLADVATLARQVVRPRYKFLLAGTQAGQAEAAEAAWASVRSGYEVVRGAARQVGRTWLDTFDGRLRTAGSSLAYPTGSGAVGVAAGAEARNADRGAAGELVLSGAVGEPLRQPVTARWPSLLDALPCGPVAERLRPVVGVRARYAGPVRHRIPSINCGVCSYSVGS